VHYRVEWIQGKRLQLLTRRAETGEGAGAGPGAGAEVHVTRRTTWNLSASGKLQEDVKAG